MTTKFEVKGLEATLQADGPSAGTDLTGKQVLAHLR